MGVADAECELLLLGGFSGRQVGRQKVFQRARYLVGSDSLNVLKGLLGGLEGLVGSNGDHLGEAFEGVDGLLDLGEGSTCLVVLFFLKETVPGGCLVQNEHLHRN